MGTFALHSLFHHLALFAYPSGNGLPLLDEEFLHYPVPGSFHHPIETVNGGAAREDHLLKEVHRSGAYDLLILMDYVRHILYHLGEGYVLVHIHHVGDLFPEVLREIFMELLLALPRPGQYDGYDGIFLGVDLDQFLCDDLVELVHCFLAKSVEPHLGPSSLLVATDHVRFHLLGLLYLACSQDVNLRGRTVDEKKGELLPLVLQQCERPYERGGIHHEHVLGWYGELIQSIEVVLLRAN